MTKSSFKRKEYNYIHKDLYKNVHDRIIHSSTELKSTQMSINR